MGLFLVKFDISVMYVTKEIRWFFKEENEPIRNWFYNLRFDVADEREDLYLDLEIQDVGVKLREGKTEIKHRIESRSKGCLNPNVWGYFEKWVKWSFDTKDDDPLYAEIMERKYNRWIPVAKERNTSQLTERNGAIITCPLSEDLDDGCQIEYSKINVCGKQWFTFGLEWFGETSPELRPSFVTEIIGDTNLAIKQSKGYPEFLRDMKQ